MSILSTKQLTKQYGTEPNIVKALDGVSISIEPGEFVAIIGTSGSGKSTLLNMLGGLDRPTSGTVKVDNYELGKLKDEDLTVFRRQRIGFIFQNYNLVPILNVYENIVMPIQLDGKKPDKKFIKEIVALLSELCIKVTLNPRKRSNYAGLGQMHSVTQVTLTQCIKCRISKHFYV